MAILNLGKVKMDIPFQSDQPSGQINGDLWGKIIDATKKIFNWKRKNVDTYEDLNPTTIAEAVTCTDTQTVESKIGGIKGLAPSIDSVTDAQYASSALDVKNHFDTIEDEIATLNGKISVVSAAPEIVENNICIQTALVIKKYGRIATINGRVQIKNLTNVETILLNFPESLRPESGIRISWWDTTTTGYMGDATFTTDGNMSFRAQNISDTGSTGKWIYINFSYLTT